MEQCVNISNPDLIINGNKRRAAAANASLNIAKKQASNLKKVSGLLRKKRAYKPLTEDQEKFLLANAELVKQFYKRREKRVEWQMRLNECEDSAEELEEKCFKLAQAVHDAEFLIVYTGAGISTAASIPDYRGPNGIWTRLQKGKDIGNHDLTTAEPTQTHMALAHLHSKGIVHHIVSQNCDGLHLRSGLPKSSLSEVHGNMYIEVCKHCVSSREYVRTFDVTEKTSTFKHTTGRRCYRCGEPLVDTIVHFGERGRLRWPLNWQGACHAAKACDTILCLGSSLKVLRKYTWLWQTHRPPKRRPKLFIVNLQWTPKDKDATLKINGKCDDVMKLVMAKLGLEVPEYKKSEDPIFQISTPLHIDEMSTFKQLPIEPPMHVSNLPNGFDPLDKRLERLNSIVHNYKNVFSNLPSNVSANDLLATLSKLEDIKDETDTEDTKPNIKEEVKEEVLKEESEDGKMGIVKSESSDEVKLEDKDWGENIASGDLLDQKIKQEDSIKLEVPAEDVETRDFQKVENYVGLQNIDSHTPDFQRAADLQMTDTQNAQTDDVHMTDLRTVDDLIDIHTDNQTDIKINNDHAGDTNATDALPHYLLKTHANKNGSLKELNFYGTGLCIRSTRQPSDHNSFDDIHHSNDDVTDDTDNSLSSAISETNHDTLESKNFECNSDVLFLSDDSSESKIDNSLEKQKYAFTSPLSNLQSFTFPISENTDISYKRNGHESESDQEFTSEISVEECAPELILSPDYSSDCHESDFGTEDGSYLIHTTVVDGVIHSAEVRTISVEYSDDKPINGDVTNVGGTAPLCTDSDTELKALWYKKFCELTDSKVKEKNVFSLELDDDVKSLWFWGFDTQPKKEKPLSLSHSVPLSTTHSPSQRQQQQRRLTRSSYQKALINPNDDSVSLVCNCLVSNPQLCRLSILKSEPFPELEEEMVKARESVRKKRQHNYKKFEPVFEVSLKSLTYERRKIRRSRKEENNVEEECDDGEEPSEMDEIRKNGDTKLVPGWYGKGYRKIVKKKRNSVT